MGVITLTTLLYIISIYRVSEKPRKANEAAYTPPLVSVAPLHRERGQLQGMESYKLRCLRNFLIRFGVDRNNLVLFVARQESYVRGCYEDKISLNPEQFSEMILLDGIFNVELFLKSHFLQLRERSDIIFENHWMWSDLLHEMLLLKCNKRPIEFCGSFILEWNCIKLPLTKHCYHARYFVEFLLFLHRPARPREQPSFPTTKFEYTRSATELQQAGVKFCCAKGNCLFDIVFTKGKLTLPRLIVNDWTETFVKESPFEQHGYYLKDITGYVILMDSLINTSADVLFNNLYKEVVTETDEFYFAELCRDLNKYSRDSFHEFKAKWFRWRKMLRRNYFGNPWSFISLLAASVLSILTLLQKVCSILQVK
ncbi:hypothetical protein CDL12_04612 [Handroanthus impetiginosus]|uniref:DUF247 domain-containing protein n=1 Tax=Handroanthus impetiginosus TaxID=429701 RepID=A0A2G9HYT4_9LAMI|nr:hypothetical protein CDL12_04612 [Handroanthus impetiginosus]